MSVPKVGQMIYVGSAFYIDHGEDDRVGGLAKVKAIKLSMSGGKMMPFVTVEEFPETSFNWEFLEREQDKLKKEFGLKQAYRSPDCPTGCTRVKRCFRHGGEF